MKRILIFLSFVIAIIFLGNWSIKSPETLPEKDNAWHSFKRKTFNTLLSLKRDFYSNNHVPLCKNKIDIIILATEEDLPTVHNAIDAAKGLVMHPINKIYLVCADSKKMRDIALEKGAEFVDENEVSPTNQKELSQKLKQEFIKLNIDAFTQSDYYLIIHANTILLQTQIFLRNDKAVLFSTEDYAIERKHMVDSFLKLGKYHNLSFHGPIMFFDKVKLKGLKNHLEKLHNRPWHEALNTADIFEQNFSAFEIYANFVLTFFPEKTMITCDKNSKIPAEHAEGVEWQRGFLSRDSKSLTFQR
ncbi:MAG: hypothetical protein NT128_04740 [Proteobacteria bacterium]|nr:hypothetical protein [Pseudomonadota bacterium]